MNNFKIISVVIALFFSSSVLAIDTEVKNAIDSFKHPGARADLVDAMNKKGAERDDSLRSAFEREAVHARTARAVEAGANVASDNH